MTLIAAIQRDAHPTGDHDVLQFAEGHLQLRDDVPFGMFALRPGPQELDHRRPRTAEAPILEERVAEGAAGKDLAGRFVGIEWQLNAAVELDERRGANRLAEGDERFDDGGAAAAAGGLAAAWKKPLRCRR